MPDAASMVKNWQQGMQSGAQKFRDAVNNVTVHPGQLAAAQQAKMLQKLTDSITSGRWASAVSGYNLQTWKAVTSGVGASNFTNGIAKGLSKYQAAANALAPRLQELKQRIAAMPSATNADNDARVLAAVSFMRSLKGIGKGGM